MKWSKNLPVRDVHQVLWYLVFFFNYQWIVPSDIPSMESCTEVFYHTRANILVTHVFVPNWSTGVFSCSEIMWEHLRRQKPNCRKSCEGWWWCCRAVVGVDGQRKRGGRSFRARSLILFGCKRLCTCNLRSLVKTQRDLFVFFLLIDTEHIVFLFLSISLCFFQSLSISFPSYIVALSRNFALDFISIMLISCIFYKYDDDIYIFSKDTAVENYWDQKQWSSLVGLVFRFAQAIWVISFEN